MKQRSGAFLTPAGLAGRALLVSGLLGGLLGAPLHLDARGPSRALLLEKASPAVVGITCRVGGRNLYFGSGTIIDPSGFVLTSVTVVPREARDIRVFVRGTRVLKARSLLVDEEHELSVIRVEPEDGVLPLPHVPLGDSSEAEVGTRAFTLGNAFQSIEADDQVSVGEGLVSGVYKLETTLSESRFSGTAIETSAHLNSGMDGGPLLDDEGKLIGVLCLNYSRSRWLGTAVPINELKPILAKVRGWLNDRDEAFAVYAGIEAETVGGAGPSDKAEVRVSRVFPGGPAAEAGLKEGETLLAVGDKPIESMETLRSAMESARPGTTLQLHARKDGEERTVEVTLWGRF